MVLPCKHITSCRSSTDSTS